MPKPAAELPWSKKFAVAVRGLLWAVAEQSSFWIHIPIAIMVVVVAAVVDLELWRWVVIVLTITLVFAAELLNSAIEQLVKVLHPQYDERIGRALDVSAAGVLVTAIGAVVVGLLTIGPPLLTMLSQ